MAITTFKLYFEKVRDKMVKPKNASNLENDPRTKMLRGLNRKHLMQIPDVRKDSASLTAFSSVDDLIQRAKKSNRGIWRVSKRQVIDIAKKYKFAIPNEHYPTKHLGSSGIILWRKGYNKYFLIKFKKQKYKRQ